MRWLTIWIPYLMIAGVILEVMLFGFAETDLDWNADVLPMILVVIVCSSLLIGCGMVLRKRDHRTVRAGTVRSPREPPESH